MNLKPTRLAAAVALVLTTATALPVHAQSTQDFDTLRNEMKKLRDEIDALKKEKHAAAAPATALGDLSDRVEQVELRTKDAVVNGDIPGSFRLPGTETSLRFYGFAELNLVHEMKGDNSDSDYSTFLPYAPLNGSAQGNRTGMTYLTGRTSRIGFEASTPSSYGPIGIKVEGDFNNEPRTGNSAVFGSVNNVFTQQQTNSYNFRLRHAYGQFGGLLIGQTWSTFMDVDNLPETVDFNGPIGATFIRQPQIRYTYPTKDDGSFTVAVENPVSYVLEASSGQPTVAGFSRVPDLIGRWDKGFDWGAISLRAITTEHKVEDGAGMSAGKRGWGWGFSGLYKVNGDDFMTWALTGGTGIGRYFNYIEGAGYDATTNSIVTEKAAGIVLGYQHKASDMLRFNGSFGYQRNYDNEYTDWARANGLDSGRFGVNRRLWQAHLGFIWNPVKGVDIGAEYIAGRRKTLAGETGDMSRIDLSAKYNFN
jgi:hypothetical protein